MGMQAFISAMGQSWVHGPRLVGTVEHFIKALVHHYRQTLATIVWVATERGPTALCKLSKSFFETFGCGDFMGFVV